MPSAAGATGFTFETASEFSAKASRLRDDQGRPVETFRFELVEGEPIDAELFRAVRFNQTNLKAFFDAVGGWTFDQKVRAVIAIDQLGVRFPLRDDEVDAIDIEFHVVDGLRDLAIQLVRDGMFGHVPEEITGYLDYDAMARDLSAAYSLVTVAGMNCAFSVGGAETLLGEF
jgi:hypothetical protein